MAVFPLFLPYKFTADQGSTLVPSLNKLWLFGLLCHYYSVCSVSCIIYGSLSLLVLACVAHIYSSLVNGVVDCVNNRSIPKNKFVLCFNLKPHILPEVEKLPN